jgi:hypothetical protein
MPALVWLRPVLFSQYVYLMQLMLLLVYSSAGMR